MLAYIGTIKTTGFTDDQEGQISSFRTRKIAGAGLFEIEFVMRNDPTKIIKVGSDTFDLIFNYDMSGSTLEFTDNATKTVVYRCPSDMIGLFANLLGDNW